MNKKHILMVSFVLRLYWKFPLGLSVLSIDLTCLPCSSTRIINICVDLERDIVIFRFSFTGFGWQVIEAYRILSLVIGVIPVDVGLYFHISKPLANNRESFTLNTRFIYGQTLLTGVHESPPLLV